MAKKEAEARITGNTPASDPLLAKVQAVFASNSGALREHQLPKKVLQLAEVIRFIGDKYIEVLGTSADYLVYYSDPEPIGGGYFEKAVNVCGTPAFDTDALRKLFVDTWSVLDELKLGIDDGLRIFEGTRQRIEKECSVEYQFVNDQLHRLDTGDPICLNEDDVVSGIFRKQPDEVSKVMGRLEFMAMSFISYMTLREIEPLSIADKVYEVKKRIGNSSQYKPYYGLSLKLISHQLETEVLLQKERKEIADSTQDHSEVKPEADMPGKFTRKEVMALLDAFSTEFREADNTAKAAFIVKLTPYMGERNIAQEFSYLRRDEYSDLVGAWLERFHKSGRGRKKRTT